MSSNHELRDTIIKVSSELFMMQSYAGTSIKDIAKAADCTTAALYYYFEDSKEGILREALDYAMPDLMGFLEPLRNASSLHELSLRFAKNALQSGRETLRKTRWIMVEEPNIWQDELDKLHQALIDFQQGLADLVEPFVEGRHDAEMFAWVLFCAVFGYGQLFITLGLEKYQDRPDTEFVRILADVISPLGK